MVKNKKSVLLKLAAVLSGSLLTAFAYASAFPEQFFAARYLKEPIKPLASQVDLLDQIFHVRFPKQIKTIGEAIDYVLNHSGYTLISPKKMEPEVINMLKNTLPLADYDFGPMTLREGLQILVGKAFKLWIDPVHRHISFHLKPEYQKYRNFVG